MARARNIKPSLFKNEVLGVADPLLTILFASLWCLADKAGRLEDRPLRIKAETFPYREGIDIDGYLTELARLGFIQRYVVDGMGLIQVKNFDKHQKPHHTEKDSELPAFSTSCHVTVKSPLENALIPDSLNTDSLIPEGGKAPVSTETEVLVLQTESVLDLKLLLSEKQTLAEGVPGRLAADWIKFLKARTLKLAKDASRPAIMRELGYAITDFQRDNKKAYEQRTEQKLPTVAEKLAEEERRRREPKNPLPQSMPGVQ
jgi:hypothetical protein